jgi:excisionase family DNA binding protein
MRQVKKIPPNAGRQPLLSVRELAEWLRVHPAMLYRAARHGTIPALRVGGGWWFSQDAVERWIFDKMADQTAVIKEPGPWLLDARRARRG